MGATINKQSLYNAFLLLQTKDECAKFLRDLLTETEIKEFSNRWKVATMLDENIPYENIAKKTGMSSTTIARVSKWLTRGRGGYRLVLSRLKNKPKNVTRI
jgi:TrpR-related protein YerC/YecD